MYRFTSPVPLHAYCCSACGELAGTTTYGYMMRYAKEDSVICPVGCANTPTLLSRDLMEADASFILESLTEAALLTCLECTTRFLISTASFASALDENRPLYCASGHSNVPENLTQYAVHQDDFAKPYQRPHHSINSSTPLILAVCYRCNIIYALAADIYNSHKNYYCPRGHQTCNTDHSAPIKPSTGWCEQLETVCCESCRTTFALSKQTAQIFRDTKRVLACPSGCQLTLPATLSSQAQQAQMEQWNHERRLQEVFPDVCGMREAKEHLMAMVVDPIRNPHVANRFGITTSGGVLLVGPPGTGKTLFAKSLSRGTGYEFVHLRTSDIKDKWFGESQKIVRKVFDEAKASNTPTVVFIDELDSLLPDRNRAEGESSSLVSDILEAIDGVSSDASQLVLLAATNRPWDVDPAALRPGRFGRIIYVGLPDEEAREELYRSRLHTLPLSSSAEDDGEQLIDTLAQLSSGYSGADIDMVLRLAAEAAYARQIRSGENQYITRADLFGALERHSPSVRPADEQRLRNYLASVA